MHRLQALVDDGVVDEVCGRLKSGKEADLWLVRHRGELVAAKIYKARESRSFRNDAGYREGRKVRDTRTQRAMDRGSRFGQAAAEEAWKAKEADALHALHAAGVRVPTPILFYEGVLLMELVVDAHGHPAPRLVDAHVAREAAAPLYADLRGQAVRMLAADVIHGDLSAYNVLLGARGPVIIDFPQVVGAAHNSQAERFFQRDVENLRRFFAAIDPALQRAEGDAREIWRAYVRRELTPEFVPSGRPPPPARQPAQAQAHRGPQPAHLAAPHVAAARDARHGAPHGGHHAGHPRSQGHGHAADARPHPEGSRRRGGPPDRRGAPPGPEVVRVVRPAAPGAATPAPPRRAPQGPPAAATPHGGHPQGGNPHAGTPHPAPAGPGGHGAPAGPAGEGEPRRRRRRRRRR